LVALAQRPVRSEEALYRNTPLVVVACDVQDPGNIGAMARVAEAAGASGMVAAGESADPFGWKALRGSMGSALRLPIVSDPHVPHALAEARSRGCRLLALSPRAELSIFDSDLRGPLAMLVGGEGAGLPEQVLQQTDIRLRVPMRPPVESLNAAVTAALVLYEASRQRA
jgi:TrmH family RNA methyltransferase